MNPPPTEETAAVLAVQIANLDTKLDAIHTSLKEDIARVELQTTMTNGTVRDHDRRLSVLKGMFLAFGVGSPFLVAAFAWVLSHFGG